MSRFVLDFERPIVELEERLESLKRTPEASELDIATDISTLEEQIDRLKKSIYADLTPWQRVQLARHPERPTSLDFVHVLIDEFIELHGDRLHGDDQAVVTGIGRFAGRSVALLAQQKGKSTKDRVSRNFGQAHPEGFRKALRIAKLAERNSLPVISFIDTQGAYPGTESEERGISVAIAENLAAFASLSVPVIVVNVGEGGSGGALGLAIGDRLFMLENAYFSVITPEGCSSILFGSADRAEESAALLKLTAQDLVATGMVDQIVPEPLGGSHRDPESVAFVVRRLLDAALSELTVLSKEDLVSRRLARIREYGEFTEGLSEELGASPERLS